MLTDPATLITCIIAVALVGISKGGFGGAFAMLGVPLMAIYIPPVQAAAILLPILLAMDAFSLWIWRKEYDAKTLWILLPSGVVGVAIGWVSAAIISEAAVRIFIGIISIVFCLHYALPRLKAKNSTTKFVPDAKQPKTITGYICGTIAGFTSFVSHSGGPPYQIYTLPLGHKPTIYTGTSVRFFAFINAVKLIPYFALGQFDGSNLTTSLLLMPIAPVATLLGAQMLRKMKTGLFYPMMYALVGLAGIKLIYDGVTSL